MPKLFETMLNGLEKHVDQIEKRLDQRMNYVESNLKERFEEAQTAIVKAEREAKEKAAAANEWRGAMDDINRRLPTRNEVEAKLDAVDVKNEQLKERLDKAEGAVAGVRMFVAIIGAGIGVLIGIVTFFSQSPIFPDIRDVQIEGTVK